MKISRGCAFDRQVRSVDCAIACLRMVLQRFYRKAPLRRDISEIAGTDVKGTTIAGFIRAATHFGVHAQAIEISLEECLELKLTPFVALTERSNGDGHYEVVHRIRGNLLLVADPSSTGCEWTSCEEFAKRWTGKLIVVAPAPSSSLVNIDRVERSPYGFLLWLLNVHRSRFIAAAVCAVLRVFLSFAILLLLRQMVSVLVLRLDVVQVYWVLFGMAIASAAGIGFQAVFDHIKADLKLRVELILKLTYVRRLAEMTDDSLRTRSSEDLMNPFRVDIIRIRDFAGDFLTFVSNVITNVIYLFLICALDLFAGVTTAACVLFILMLTLFYRRAISNRATENTKTSKLVATGLSELISGNRYFKLSNSVAQFVAGVEQQVFDSLESSRLLSNCRIHADSAGRLASGFIRIAGLISVISGAMTGSVSIGQLIMVYLLLYHFGEAVRRTMMSSLHMQDPAHSADRLLDVTGEDIESTSGENHRFQAISESICFRSLHTERDAGSQIDLTIPASSCTAIVDSTGRLCTLLWRTLTRLAEPPGGSVLVDNVHLADFDRETVRAGVALISDDAFVFRGTMLDNLRLESPDATLDEVIVAAQTAGLHDFVNDLPSRYQAVIGGTTRRPTRSQRRRIAVVRALLKTPVCVIVDIGSGWTDQRIRQQEQRLIREQWSDVTTIILARSEQHVEFADVRFLYEGERITVMDSPDSAGADDRACAGETELDSNEVVDCFRKGD